MEIERGRTNDIILSVASLNDGKTGVFLGYAMICITPESQQVFSYATLAEAETQMEYIAKRLAAVKSPGTH